MGISVRRKGAVVALIALLLSACSTPERESAPSDAAGLVADEGCADGAKRIVERLGELIDSLSGTTPDDFVAEGEIEGLPDFQTDVAQIIAETSDQRSTLCNLNGLQDRIAAELTEFEREGVLAEFLIATIQSGGELTQSDVQVTPTDDLEAVLALLDDGSSITLGAGTYDLGRPLVVQRSISFVGDGVATTTLASTSGDAAIVVAGRGELIMRDLAVEHVGDAPASVILSFGRPVNLAQVRLAGGVPDGEGGAGNGLVLTDETLGGVASEPATTVQSVVSDTRISDNAGAGIAVNGALAPQISGSEIDGNDICGVCYFGTSGGSLSGSTVRANEFGVQIADAAQPLIADNLITENVTAGIVALGESAAEIRDNRVEANTEIGIAIQESASALVAFNQVADQTFGMSVLSTGVVRIEDNTFTNLEVGLQADEAAQPSVLRNTLTGTTAVGIAHSGASAGQFEGNIIAPADGVGVLMEGTSSPSITDLSVTGGEVAVAAAGQASGRVSASTFVGQSIGVQVDEQSSPTLTDLDISDAASAGLVFRSDSTATLRNSRISDAVEVGFVVTDAAEPMVVDSTFTDVPTGGSILGTGSATVTGNTFMGSDVGLQVGESATPSVSANTFESMATAGLVFLENGGGDISENIVREPGVVAIQLGGSASPSLVENVLFVSRQAPEGDGDAVSVDDSDGELPDGGESTGEATVGILYAEESVGTAMLNQIVGFVIGMQIGENSAPTVTENVVDGGDPLGVGYLFRNAAAGLAEANLATNVAIGFQVGDEAVPTLRGNTVTRVVEVSFLIQDAANPILEENICSDLAPGIGLLGGVDPNRTDNQCTEVTG